MNYKITLELKTFNFIETKNKINKILKLLNKIKIIKIKGPVTLPIKKKRFVVLRSPHVHKQSREHFEIFNYKTILIFNCKYISPLLIFINFIKNQLLLDFELKTKININYNY